MKSKNIVLLLSVILLSFGYISQDNHVQNAVAGTQSFYTKIKIFTAIIETIQRSYIEQMDAEELLEDAIKGITQRLDPHTIYLPPNDFKYWNQNFEGFTGIGVGFEVIDGAITVMSVMAGSPAEEVGILAGDKISRIDGRLARGMSKDEAANSLNGDAGVPVLLEIKGENWAKPREVELVRKRIHLKSVPHALMVRPQVGYIQVDRFTSTTPEELDEALEKLENQGMRYLLLDLRGNGGGYLNAAVEVVDRFVPGGHRIVSTKGRTSTSFQEFHSTNEKTRTLHPLVVLIDHGSASASEIVAGAIQDLDRGLIAGKTSFGKGLVQSQYRFHDGSALLVTTARYYTPSGRPIQRNFIDKSRDEYYREAYDDSLYLAKGSRNPELGPYKTLLGRSVYAEGGIRPDIWIENDGNLFSHEVRELFFSDERFFYAFAEHFASKHPGVKKNEETFIRRFVVTNEVYNNFLDFVKKSDSHLAKLNFDRKKDEKNIKFLLKRTMAYIYWGDAARFRVNLTRDHQVIEALKYVHQANLLLSMTADQR